jgi:hypothetical protein
MSAQVDMSGTTPVNETALVGPAITLPEHCPHCSGYGAVIGAGRGPRKPSIMCVCCTTPSSTTSFGHSALRSDARSRSRTSTEH